MLPLQLLTASQATPILVELKNGTGKLMIGETFNGHLLNCDNWMNINLQNVIKTSKDGKRFFKAKEIYIKGNTIKYLRVQEQVLEKVIIQEQEQTAMRGQRGRGGSGQRGRGGSGQRGGRGGSGQRGGRGKGPSKGVKKQQKD